MSIIALGRIASRSFKKTLACPLYATRQLLLRHVMNQLHTVWRVYTLCGEIRQFLEIRIHDYFLLVGVFEWLGSFYGILALCCHSRTTSQPCDITSHDCHQLDFLLCWASSIVLSSLAIHDSTHCSSRLSLRYHPHCVQ